MNQPANNNNDISDFDVAEYLKHNTDFFLQYPDLLLNLKLDAQPEGSISLVERQMKGLRERNKEIEKELKQVIGNAQDNQNLLQLTFTLSLNLIPANDLDSLSTTLFAQLKELFHIDYRNLILDNQKFEASSDLCVDMQPVKDLLGDNFPNQQPVCGRLKDAEKQAIFSDGAKVSSAAILPLGDKGELGLLVLGSEDATHFDPEMGNLFLSLIADMLGKLLYRFS